MTDDEFRQLVSRVRAGDPDAAASLVRAYEPEIRRVIRVRLVNPQLQRAFDSMDVAQSVFANFFVRAGTGQFDLDSPERLVKLLVTMARNKLTDLARKHKAARRGAGQAGGDPEQLEQLPDTGTSPSSMVANAELIREAHKRMSPEERYIAEQRALGRDWSNLGAELGTTGEALRKRYARAVARVAEALGLGTGDVE
jgi:RNA polymerase sigma factor (sigma-70 family)